MNQTAPPPAAALEHALSLGVPPVPRVETAADRLTLLDPLRTLAVLLVIWFHVVGEAPFGIAVGVPLFLLVRNALATRKGVPDRLTTLTGRKGPRLLRSWLFWSAVYGVAHAVADVAQGEPAFAFLEPRMLFYGTHIHLWFLPFALITIVLVNLLQHALRRVPSVLVVACAVAAGTAIAFAAPDEESLARLGRPFAQWVVALPAIPFGMAIGRAHAEGAVGSRRTLLVGIAAAAALLLVVLPGHPLRYGVAVPIVCGAFLWRPQVPQVFGHLAGLTLGVYLLHIFFVRALAGAARETTPQRLGLVLAVFALAAAAVLLVRRTPLRRFV